jgi:hypothetical protein
MSSLCRGWGGSFSKETTMADERKDMEAAYPAPRDLVEKCEPWCGNYEVRAETAAVCMLVKGPVFRLASKAGAGDRTFCCHEKALAAAGLKMYRIAETPKGFLSEGLAHLLVKSQHDLRLGADAERLPELLGPQLGQEAKEPDGSPNL